MKQLDAPTTRQREQEEVNVIHIIIWLIIRSFHAVISVTGPQNPLPPGFGRAVMKLLHEYNITALPNPGGNGFYGPVTEITAWKSLK